MSFGAAGSVNGEGWDEDIDVPVAGGVSAESGDWDEYIEDGLNGEGDEDWDSPVDEVPSVDVTVVEAGLEEESDWGEDVPVAGSVKPSTVVGSDANSEGWDDDVNNIMEDAVKNVEVVKPVMVDKGKVPGFIPPPPSAVRGKQNNELEEEVTPPVNEVDSNVEPTPVQEVVVSHAVEDNNEGWGEEEVAVDTTVGVPSVSLPVSTPVVEVIVPTPVQEEVEGVTLEEDEGWGEDIPVAGGGLNTGGVFNKVDDDWWGEDTPVAVIPAQVEVSVAEVSDVSEPLPDVVSQDTPVAVIPAPPQIVLETPGEKIVSRKEERKETVVKPAVKKKRKSNTIGGVRLTTRDLQMMGLLARYRFATVSQLAKRFETSETALRNRLPRLEKAGLITFRWAAQTQPKLWMITEKGLQTVGMTLTAPKVDYPQLRHGLGLVDLGISFELAGEIVVTEREIRAAATRYMPTPRMRSVIDMTRFMPGFGESADGDMSLEDMKDRVERSLILPMPATHARGHIPDMVVARQPFANGASGNIAVELELTRKPISTWKDILTAYRDSTNFAQVYYFVMDKEIGRALKKVVEVIGAEDKIMVEAVAPRDLSVREG